MNWTERMGLEFIRRIVVLLFSLADHAQHVSIRPWRVRRHVLANLRRAEAVAYRCIAETAARLGVPVPAIAIVACGEWMACADEGDGLEDALRLAARLRALAMALACLSLVMEAHGAGDGPIAGLEDASAVGFFPSASRSALLPALSVADALNAPIRAPPHRSSL